MTEQFDGKGDRPAIGSGLIVTLLVLVVAVIFVVQNTDSASLTFLGFDFTMPLWLLFVISLIMGAILGSVGRWYMARRRRRS